MDVEQKGRKLCKKKKKENDRNRKGESEIELVRYLRMRYFEEVRGLSWAWRSVWTGIRMLG